MCQVKWKYQTFRPKPRILSDSDIFKGKSYFCLCLWESYNWIFFCAWPEDTQAMQANTRLINYRANIPLCEQKIYPRLFLNSWYHIFCQQSLSWIHRWTTSSFNYCFPILLVYFLVSLWCVLGGWGGCWLRIFIPQKHQHTNIGSGYTIYSEVGNQKISGHLHPQDL